MADSAELMKGVSVVICCFNSASRLGDTLSHLAKQQYEHSLVEIIVINNNSTDNTAHIAKSTWQALRTDIAITIVEEEKPGLSHARRKGLKIARFEYVVFCDDDNWLCETYLQTISAIFNQFANVAIIGGCGVPVFEKNPPDWFWQLNGFGYALGSEGRVTGEVSSAYGAGMGVRKSVLLHLLSNTGSLLLSDRKGTGLHSGGDVEICQLVLEKGYKIYYDERLIFSHFMPAQRLLWSYYLKLRQSFGRAEAYLQVYHPQQAKNIVANTNKRFLLFWQLVRLSIRHIHFLAAPQLFKSKYCASFYQEMAKRKVLFTDRLQLAELASSKKHNPIK
jgi:glycosyltransferase involved in cell wall biosynthesis